MPRRNRHPRIRPVDPDDREPPTPRAAAQRQPARVRVDYELRVRELVDAGLCPPTALDSSSRWLSARLANTKGPTS